MRSHGRSPLSPQVNRTARVATAADLAALERLPLTAEGLRTVLFAARTKPALVHVVEQSGTLIGVGCCARQANGNLAVRGYDGEINLILVLPEYQRQGVGALLLASMARDLSQRGFHEVTSWVKRENAAARRFYVHHGGQVVAEREHAVDNKVSLEFAYAWTQLNALQRVAPTSH